MRTRIVSAVTLTTLCILLALSVLPAQCAVTQLISRDRLEGTQGNSTSGEEDISSDGRFVVFRSMASNLVDGVDSGVSQIFIRDRNAGNTELVSVQTDGYEANGACDSPSVSDDGRYVVYSSYATGIIAGIGDGTHAQIFLRDRVLGANILVTTSPAAYGNNNSFQPTISADGRYVAFKSNATNLMGGTGPTGFYQIYLWDRLTSAKTLVSHTPSGDRCGNSCDSPSISAEGGHVVFYSPAGDLTGGLPSPQIFLWTRSSGTIEVASLDSAGNPVAAGVGDKASMNSGGQFVVFQTYAADVLPGVGDGAHSQIYMRNRMDSNTVLISRNSDGETANGNCTNASLSGDTNHTLFYSDATNLGFGVDGSTYQLYKRDRNRNLLDLVTVDYNGNPLADYSAMSACMSGDGRYVAFHSGKNILPGISWGFHQVFCRDTAFAPQNISLTPSGGSLAGGPFTIEATYRDMNGAPGIRKCYLLLNDSASQVGGVLVMYDWSTSKLYLKNDANTSWGTGYADGTDVVLQNSQCYFYVKDTVVSGGETDFWLRWRLELKAPFSAKNLNGYMYVQDETALTDGWERMGIYYNVKPQVVSVSPDGPLPIDSTTTLTSVYRDLNGSADLRRCYLVVCEGFNQANSMFLFYDKATNRIYLKNDANTSWGTGYAPGTIHTLSNSQCDVYTGDTTVTEAGNDVTIAWSFRLKPTMADKNLYSWMYVTDSAAAFDGWKKVGTHFTPVAPTCVSVTPSTGKVQTGTPLVFRTTYSDDNGTPDIYLCYFQIGQTGSLANNVVLLYDVKQGKVFLRNDANTSWGTGYAPGTPVVLENNQCKVYVESTSVSSDSDDIAIDWNIELKAVLIPKLLGERMYCRDNEYLNSGWKLRGTVRAQ